MVAMLGPEDLLLLGVVVVLLFGAKKLPELARGLGRAKHEFHKGMREGASEDERDAGTGAGATSAGATSAGPAAEEPASGIHRPNARDDGGGRS